MSTVTINSFPREYSLLSNNNATHDTTALVGLVVHGRLDCTKLENAHRELVHLWPALGGKLVTSKTPYAFTSGDIVNFKSRRLDKQLSDFSLVTTFSLSSNSKPSLHPLASDIDNLFHFEAIEKVPPADTIFALRVTVLQDATLLGFRFAHHLFDGHACFETVQAYCDVLSRRLIPKLIPPPDIDSLLSKQVVGEDSLPPVKLDSSVWPELNMTLSAWGTFCFTIVFMIRILFVRVGLRDGDEERILHLPGSLVAQLTDECRNEMDKLGLKELKVTKNNVITAWFLKKFYSKFSSSTKVGVDVMTSFNFRPHIPSPQPNTTYLHNSFYNLRTPFPSLAYLQSLTPSEIALALRKTCLMHKQPSVVKANLQFYEKVKAVNAPHPPDRTLSLFVEHEMPFFSHWTSFHYHLLDFSSALERDVDGSGVQDDSADRKGKVALTLPSCVFPFGFKIRPLIFFTKDGQGGYWIRARLPTAGWRGIEESMENLSHYDEISY